MGDRQEVLANFLAITDADHSSATQMLEATGYDLQAAIDLFFAAGPAGVAPGGGPPAHTDDEALARQLQQEAGPAEDEVRAPIPTRTERLYGDDYHPAAFAPPRRRGPPNLGPPAEAVDAFRDFSAQGEGGSGLASLFEPPRGLLFAGHWDEAKAAAAQQGRWLIVNVQNGGQFASHQLNRDTWRDDMVKSLVQENFIFYQVYDAAEEGQKLMSFYHIFELPATLVVDPLTGAPMRQWTGFVPPDRLLEDLMPFLDHGINDPAASRLAASTKRKKLAARQGSAGPAAAAEGSELQRAIEASMRQSDSGTAVGRQPTAEEEEAEERAILEALHARQEAEAAAAAAAAAPSAAEVAAAAAARLPEEPVGPEGCRVALRLPSGRLQRRFPRAAPLSAVYDWCRAECEEAAGGRPFVLTQAVPGAPPLTDLDQSLEVAGVADAMLALKWDD